MRLHLYDFATPTPASRYLLFPALAAGTVGAGVMLVSAVQGMPAHMTTYNALGWGLITFGNTLFVSVYSIGNERAAYFEKQAEQEAHKPYPELMGYDSEVVDALTPVNPPASKNGFITVAVRDEDTGSGADLFNPTWALWHMARHGGADSTTTSEEDWSGRGKPFSLGEFRELRNWLITEGLAWWVNDRAHSQGWKIRPRARAIMRGLAAVESYSPPLPTGRRS